MLDANKLQQAVDQAYTQFHSLNGGQNADYIPFLANVPGQLAAVAIVTCDGNIYRAGDSDYRFALESISKVCTLALALEDVGPQAVQDKVGADPTGLPFNSVIALELHGGKPLSPLVNAGAIATTSLINAENTEQRWQRILHIQQQLAGEQVALSDEVNQSEQTTNFHNRAIAWLLYSAGYLYCDAMEACDVYTRQCSTLINRVEFYSVRYFDFDSHYSFTSYARRGLTLSASMLNLAIASATTFLSISPRLASSPSAATTT